MQGIASLGSIRELVLLTASCWGADETFRCAAQLTQLTRLVFGTSLPVSDAGLLGGLAPLSKLRSLQLLEFDCITDQGVDGLSRLDLPCLQASVRVFFPLHISFPPQRRLMLLCCDGIALLIKCGVP